jgi:excinuclease ABC subunit C
MINLDTIPENPGIYIMKKGEKVIYVGKAKNLKNRVFSYFKRKSIEDKKTEELVKNAETVDYIITKSEADALILENNLIKKYKPKYNIMLKDEKTYPYIYISKERYPKLIILRSSKRDGKKSGDYFGPYPMSVYSFVKMIKRSFKIRDCNRDMDKNYERPCLKYYMRMCNGPCVYKNIEKDYIENINEVKEILKGNSSKILKDIEDKMKKSSENMEYEKAIVYRSKIENIKSMEKNQICEHGKATDEDVIAFEEKEQMIFMCILNIRDGKIINKYSFNTEKKIEEDDIFERVFTMYYDEKDMPKHIILDKKYLAKEEILKEWIKIKEKSLLEIHFPIINSRRMELLEMAYINLNDDIKKTLFKERIVEEGVVELKDSLNLQKYPLRIECFDISNIQGKDAVGSMSVALRGKVTPREYRKFKIEGKDTPDDFEMMREVMIRRYLKLEDDKFPDLILIDGGKGQLNAAFEILDSIGKSGKIEIISIAKKEELVFKSGIDEPYRLSRKSEALKILQRVRDEAHRFGITYHRKLRSKRVISSELDNIKGIGEKTKQKLLKTFGSADRVKKASLEELKSIVSEKIALEIIKKEKNS